MPAAQTATLDATFSALADPTRRGILERLGQGDATITELATRFEMTLTGVKKHVAILEAAGLVATAKVGRVRHCTLGARTLDAEAAWIAHYRALMERRLDRLSRFVEASTPGGTVRAQERTPR